MAALRTLLSSIRRSRRGFCSGVAGAQGRPPLVLRPPVPEDVTAIHQLVRSSGLDVNSPYAYTLGALHFPETCIVAQRPDLQPSLVGFVHGYRPPAQQDTLFVWQVATDSRVRGLGYGSSMVLALLSRLAGRGVRYLEATITPGLDASQNLFRGIGQKLGCPVEVNPGFVPANDAVDPVAKAEDLYRIGSFSEESIEAYLSQQSGDSLETRQAEKEGLLFRTLEDVEAAGNYKRGGRAKWESRRYLTRSDGMGFSFHHTVMYKDKPSFQWYKNHVESVYITEGFGTIEIVQEGSPEDFERFIGTGVTYELKPGSMYALRGEKHILTAKSEGGMHCMCVFNPPVAGSEDHDARGVYPAVDDKGVSHYEYGPQEVPELFKAPDVFRSGSGWCE